MLASAARAERVHIDEPDRFEVGLDRESWTFEVHVPTAADALAPGLDVTLDAALASPASYAQRLDPAGSSVAARRLGHERTYYWNDDRTASLPLGQVGALTLIHHQDSAAYHRAQLAADFGARVDPDADLPALGLSVEGDDIYSVSPTHYYLPAADFSRLERTEAYDGGVRRLVADAYRLVMVSATDEVGNRSSAQIDYHLLAPWQLTDPNGTVEEIDYDPLGVGRRTSRRGSALDRSSTVVPHGFAALTLGSPRPSFAAALAAPETELGGAESLTVYAYPASVGAPMRMLSVSAEQFVDRGPDAGAAPERAQVQVSYLDGFGRSLQQRRLVEDGSAWVEDAATGELVEGPSTERWQVSGYLAYDAKQRPRQRFEPFFRDGVDYEPALARRRFGVSPTTTFDGVGRSVREMRSNGSFAETTYSPWAQTSRDPNDTVEEATDYKASRETLPSGAPERDALEQAQLNKDTPRSVHFDGLGREIASVEVIEGGVELTEQSTLDIRGLSEQTLERRGLSASTRAFDMLGRAAIETSMDAGERRVLFDALGREVKTWREGTASTPETVEERAYDAAGRMTERWVSAGASTWLAERMTYGEGAPSAADRNQLGRLIRSEDAAGREEVARYGAFGEVLESERTLTATAGLDPDWSAAVALEASGYRSVSSYDAAGRRVRAELPDGTTRTSGYLRSGPTQTLEITTPDGTTRTVMTGAVYNARGQQLSATLGNGVEVDSVYDAETFRLYRRRSAIPGTDPYQDLRHHYDPVGNLVYLDDLAQTPTSARVLNGLTVTAERRYRYDARYQLTRASGRFHNALMKPDFRGDAPPSGSFRGTRRVGLNDGGQVSRYVRTYSYDDSGNLTGWVHGPEGALPGASWNNTKWVSPTSNRSYVAEDLNGIAISDPASRFDARGQITELPSVRAMQWSAREQLRRAVLIERASDPDDDEAYDYAADGRRVRKVRTRLVTSSPLVVETVETLELDGCQLRRITRGSTPRLLRWSSHVADDETRVATVYHWQLDVAALETDDVNQVREHYPLGTHLGSIAMELDGAGARLSYEEYFPYGRTAFLAGDAVREIRLRTLRFVGKEQDDATGFYSFQYRYYAPFLGNWVSPDPAGEVDGPNRYRYARNNPPRFVDPYGLQASSVDDEDLEQLFIQSDSFEEFLLAYERMSQRTAPLEERERLREEFEAYKREEEQRALETQEEASDEASSSLASDIVMSGGLAGVPVIDGEAVLVGPDVSSDDDAAAVAPAADAPAESLTLEQVLDRLQDGSIEWLEELAESRLEQQFDFDDPLDIAVALGVAASILGEVLFAAVFEEIRDQLIQAGIASTVGGPAAAAIMLTLAVGQFIHAVASLTDAETRQELVDVASRVIQSARSGTATVAELGGLIAAGLQVLLATAGTAAALRRIPEAIRAMRGNLGRLLGTGAPQPAMASGGVPTPASAGSVGSQPMASLPPGPGPGRAYSTGAGEGGPSSSGGAGGGSSSGGGASGPGGGDSRGGGGPGSTARGRVDILPGGRVREGTAVTGGAPAPPQRQMPAVQPMRRRPNPGPPPPSTIQRDVPLQAQLAGTGQLAALRSSPNLRGVDIEDILTKTPDEIDAMVSAGNLTPRQRRSIFKAFEGRNLRRGGRGG